MHVHVIIADSIGNYVFTLKHTKRYTRHLYYSCIRAFMYKYEVQFLLVSCNANNEYYKYCPADSRAETAHLLYVVLL